jgi:3-deoxy-D-manno-octulosonate 8-phosphate phosphatase KdsC-like HAD superfamily phosphatase
MPLKLDAHDEAIVATVQAEMKKAILTAHGPVAVAKRIGALGIRQRNHGRLAAIKRYPFKGICEASGMPLARELVVLDEVEPERG